MGFKDKLPLKLACYTHSIDKEACPGYLRRVDQRTPFLSPPKCEKGTEMELYYTKSNRPWEWKCIHKTCRKIRWAKGDLVP